MDTPNLQGGNEAGRVGYFSNVASHGFIDHPAAAVEVFESSSRRQLPRFRRQAYCAFRQRPPRYP